MNRGTTTEEADGSSSYRDAYFQTRWTAGDPRFEGRGEYTANSNTYAIGLPQELTVGWGTQTLTTDEGTWTSRSGSFAIVDGDESVIPIWFEGGGAYDGMSAFLLQQIHETPDIEQAYFTFEGWIVPGDRHFDEAIE